MSVAKPKMTINKLRQFNQRAQKLADSRILAWLRTSSNKQIFANLSNSGEWLAYENLNPDDVDSFCLNLRFLLQGRDGLSIKCLSYISQQVPEGYQESKDFFCARKAKTQRVFLRKNH